MKKILFILLCFFGLMFACKTVVLSFDFSKVIYETEESYTSLLTTEDTVIDIAKDKIIVRVELKLEDAYSQLVCDMNNKTFIVENNNKASYQTTNKENNNLTVDQIKVNKKNNNAILKAYHQNKNQTIDRKIDISGYEEKYVCQYSPYIEYTFNKAYFLKHQNNILKKFSTSTYVKNVYVTDYDSYEYDPLIAVSTDSTGIRDIYRSREYTGDGIYIGLLEVGDVDKTHEELRNADLEIYKEVERGTQYIRSHATNMAISLASPDGIVPDVKIKSAAIVGSFIDEIEWMIAKGVDIINMSFGENDPDGIYDSKSAYVDYVAYTYGIIMVASVGNNLNNNSNICNPGLGYNVISLGASEYFHRGVIPESSYTVANTQQPFKPTLCADGDNVNICGQVCVIGTSVSAIIATANIAILLEMFPQLIGDPRTVIALLVANAKPFPTSTYPYITESAMAVKAGAGRLYTRAVINNIDNIICFNNSTGQPHDIIYTHNIYLNPGQTIRVSAAWLAKSTGATDGITRGDYDIYLLSPSGEQLAYSMSSRSIVEVMTYTSTAGGACKIIVIQCSNRIDSVDSITIAYQIAN